MAQHDEEIDLGDLDLGALEPVEVRFAKNAFAPKTLACPKCETSGTISNITVRAGSGVFVQVKGFKCPKCKRQYMGLDQAARFSQALLDAVGRRQDFAMERKLSFDGDNYTVRVPKELTRNVKKRRILITPLGPNKFLARVE